MPTLPNLFVFKVTMSRNNVRGPTSALTDFLKVKCVHFHDFVNGK